MLHVPYGWVGGIAVVVAVLIWRYGWLLAKDVWAGWGDGPSREALDEMELREDGC